MAAPEVIEIGGLPGGERKQSARQAALAHYTSYLKVLAPPSHQADAEQWASDFFRENTLDASFGLDRYKGLFNQMFHVNLQELAACCGTPERCLHVLEVFTKLRSAFTKEFDSNRGDIVCGALKILKDRMCAKDFDPACVQQLSAIVSAVRALTPAGELQSQESGQADPSREAQIEAALEDLVHSYFSPMLNTALITKDGGILKDHFELLCRTMGPESVKINPDVLFSKGAAEIGKEAELLDTLAADLVRSEERYYKEFGKKRFQVIRSKPVEFEALAQVARREVRHLPKLAKLAQSCHELQSFLTAVEELGLGTERKFRLLPGPLSELGKKASAILERSAWRLEVYSHYLPAVLAALPQDPSAAKLARLAHHGVQILKPRFETARAQLQSFAGWAG